MCEYSMLLSRSVRKAPFFIKVSVGCNSPTIVQISKRHCGATYRRFLVRAVLQDNILSFFRKSEQMPPVLSPVDLNAAVKQLFGECVLVPAF